MAKLSPLDFAFLVSETPESPKHVAALQIFESPAGTRGKKKFVQNLFTALIGHTQCTPPFNQKLKAAAIGMPEWVEDNDIELAYHVRHSVLPDPGSREQLYELVSRLHANLLDRSRPLWEFHLISGMERGRFACYLKMHHAMTDGMNAMRLTKNMFSDSPDDGLGTPIWVQPVSETGKHGPQDFLAGLLGKAKLLGQQAGMTSDLAKIALRLSTQAVGLSREKLPIPFTAPTTALNVPLAKARAFSSAMFPFERLKRVSKTANVSLNDVMLTVCDMGIQWYLREQGAAPVLKEPLVCQVPISVRREGETGGNKVAMGLVKLGGSTSAPRERLQEISRSAADFKEVYGVMDPGALMTYTLLVQGLAQVADLVKITERLPPLANMLLSNVPGSRKTLYLNGAPLVELYPVSAMPPGMAFNITVLSYAGSMFMGIIAGRSATPALTRMTDYMAEAFETLEEAVLGKAT